MASLVVKPPGGKAYRVGLDAGAVTVGRSSSNRISLADDPKVSREHCRVERSGDHFAVVDLGTSNGTKVNGRKVGPGGQELFNRDEITVGSTKLLVEDPANPRGSLAQKLASSILGVFSGGAKKGPDDGALLAKGRMRCSCGTILNISGKAPGDKVGCPRCRSIHRVPK